MQESAEPKLYAGDKKPKRAPRQKRVKFNVSFPGEAMPFILAQRKRLKMSMSQFLNSLVAYQCWCEKEHHLTGDAIREGGEAERKMWLEIIADTGKPDKTGSLFAHKVADFMKKLAK